MKREIKFRAWIRVDVDYEDNDIKAMTYDLAFSKYEPINDLLNKQSDLMQFTGLKDKNGVDIYEGDILNVQYNYYGNQIVKFDNGKYNISKFLLEKCQVIGNIYENPELI
jgi:uncharacterized phage protein (TIGR01671 family)